MRQIPLKQVISIWWSMIWRWTLVGGLAGFLLGGIGGFIMGFAGYAEYAGFVGGLLGWLASILVSIWALKAALSKDHGGNSIVFVEPEK